MMFDKLFHEILEPIFRPILEPIWDYLIRPIGMLIYRCLEWIFSRIYDAILESIFKAINQLIMDIFSAITGSKQYADVGTFCVTFFFLSITVVIADGWYQAENYSIYSRATLWGTGFAISSFVGLIIAGKYSVQSLETSSLDETSSDVTPTPSPPEDPDEKSHTPAANQAPPRCVG